MKKGMMVFAVASGLSLLASSFVNAGNRPGAFTFTPGVGVDFFAVKRDFNNTSVLPEISLTYNFDDRWAIEGTYNTFGTSYRNNRTVKGDLYLVDAIYRLTPIYTRIEPYVTAGFGVYYLNPNNTNANSQGNINLGVGAQLFFTDSIALRLEGRNLYTWVGGKNDQMINLGVSFLLGGTKPAPAAAPYKGEMPQAAAAGSASAPAASTTAAPAPTSVPAAPPSTNVPASVHAY